VDLPLSSQLPQLDKLKLQFVPALIVLFHCCHFDKATLQCSMGSSRVLLISLLIVVIPAGAFFAALLIPQVHACYDAAVQCEAMVNQSRPDFVIHNSVDVRDQPQLVDALFQWREHFKDLEQRVLQQSVEACAALHLSEATVVLVLTVLFAALLPCRSLILNVWLQFACAASAIIAMLMLLQHRIQVAFVAIIEDLRDTMAHHILPLTHQDDYHLYSLIYASTALRKSDRPHGMPLSLLIPGLDAPYELSPSLAGCSCVLLSLVALWLAASRYISQGLSVSADKKVKDG
jgi:hypothetical protein